MWIKLSERRPTEAETCNGRVAAIDEDGFAVVAVRLSSGLLISNGIPIIAWMPLPRWDGEDVE